jgi:hypothetical protein
MPTHSVGPTAATANSRRRVVSAGRNIRDHRTHDGGYTPAAWIRPTRSIGLLGDRMERTV